MSSMIWPVHHNRTKWALPGHGDGKLITFAGLISNLQRRSVQCYHSRRAVQGIAFNAASVSVFGQYLSHSAGSAWRAKSRAQRPCAMHKVQTRCRSRSAAGSIRATSFGSRSSAAIRHCRRSAAFGPRLATARNSEADIRMSFAMRSISASSQHPNSDPAPALIQARHQLKNDRSRDWLCLP